MKNFGMLHVYTGTGKGKTTAALGVALRALGHGARVTMIGFMKGDASYGEARIAAALPGFTLKQMGRDAFVNFRNPDAIDVRLAREAWEEAKRILREKEADLLILDEINLAMAKDLIHTEEAVAFLKGYRDHTEVICTGREAPPALLAEADLVTDMREIKHYYARGVPIRDGIDH